jgi:hypothetical protein
VIERRLRWERALGCTRSEVLLEFYLASIPLLTGIALHPQVATAFVIAAGFGAGAVVHLCNRLVLAQPPFLRRIDWEHDPDPPAPERSFAAGLLVAVFTVAAIGAVYLSAGRNWTVLIAYFGGSFLALALIALFQRIVLERDFVRIAKGSGAR